jgi:hypothetical protein
MRDKQSQVHIFRVVRKYGGLWGGGPLFRVLLHFITNLLKSFEG